MIVCRYRKRGRMPSCRTWTCCARCVWRSAAAGADIAFSEGFNPHMLLKLSSPLPLGVESDCEYLAAASTDAPDAFAEKLNRTLPTSYGYCAPAGRTGRTLPPTSPRRNTKSFCPVSTARRSPAR